MMSSKLDDHQQRCVCCEAQQRAPPVSLLILVSLFMSQLTCTSGASSVILFFWIPVSLPFLVSSFISGSKPPPRSKMHLPTSSLAGPASSFLLAASSLLCLISLSTADDGTINFGTPLNNAATLNEDSNLILVRLYHAFNSSQQYQNRALITINNQVPIIKQDSISQELLEYLKESAISGDFYYLKAQAYRTLDMDNEEPYQVSTTFLRSCALLESLLSDQLVINLDVNGKFVFLSANVPGQYCAESSPLTASSMINAIGDNSNHFNTSIFLMKTSVNAGPETKTYLQRIEQERQEKLRGAKQDNRSFLAKYWMYIVPVVIFMVISGMNPEGGASG